MLSNLRGAGVVTIGLGGDVVIIGFGGVVDK
jgi:hypothetical protein